jgi:Holliday junction resolvase-like predicted endonuclease
MKNFTSKAQKIGKLGEDIAAKFLMKHGFSIVDRNYTKKWGELDIIAQKEDKIYFIEVKSASRSLSDLVTGEIEQEGTEGDFLTDNLSAQGESSSTTANFFQLEENMHPWKRRRLARTIETYLISKRVGNTPWQFDVLLVFLDTKLRKARVRMIENIIL